MTLMMTHREALEVVAGVRRDHVVVTTMGSAVSRKVYCPFSSDRVRLLLFPVEAV